MNWILLTLSNGKRIHMNADNIQWVTHPEVEEQTPSRITHANVRFAGVSIDVQETPEMVSEKLAGCFDV